MGRASRVAPPYARSEMEQVFTVTLVRPSSGLPSIEVGAYEYLGARLPAVGDTIGIRPVSSPGGLFGTVTAAIRSAEMTVPAAKSGFSL